MKPAALLLLHSSAAFAQDPFKIHVYDDEEIKRGQFTLEQHLNEVPTPGYNEFHMTYELTGAMLKKRAFGTGFQAPLRISPHKGGAGLSQKPCIHALLPSAL